MPAAVLSAHIQKRQPSPIRLAQNEFLKRTGSIKAINTAIGNVSLPLHPAMQERMFNLQAEGSPFKNGVDQYTATAGFPETRQAFLNVIQASGFDTTGLMAQPTDGGSQAMELVLIAMTGPSTDGGSLDERPLLLIDPAYANYGGLAERLTRKMVFVRRTLTEEGKFTLPDLAEIEQRIKDEKPGGIVVIPYDNPTGQFFPQETMNAIARLCVQYNIWMLSDEAYRELHYNGQPVSSIWGVTEAVVPGITGHRMSIESVSKTFNGCGLRIGAIVTDNTAIHEKLIAENVNLCPNAIGQYIVGALAHLSAEEIQAWFGKQRQYYQTMSRQLVDGLREAMPELIVSEPEAALYSVIDVRRLVKPGFSAQDFVLWCAKEGSVKDGEQAVTLLVAPMAGFYTVAPGEQNPGLTQMRLAYVEPPEVMAKIPQLFAELLRQYEAQRS